MKQAIKIKDNIYWVGVHDFNCRHFHGEMFPISEGTSYNAYLLIDKEITVIDTVEEEFMDIMFERIASVIGDKAVDNVIVQHAEPDHSSGFKLFMDRYPNAQPYASNAGVQIMMKQYFHEYAYQKVKTGDFISTGTFSLSFVEMPLIHWPDNMLTYVKEAKIAFSNDAFGQHIASYDIFDDGHGLEKCLDCAKDYYANIVMPYGDRVMKKLQDIQAMQFDIDMIAPAHGVIWRSYTNDILSTYMELASFQAKNKVVIIYESIWKHTQMMAEALAEGIGQSGVCVKVYKLSETSSALIMKEIVDAKAILVGSGCYNNDIASNVHGFLAKLKTCHVKNKYGLGFGSYGWYRNTTLEINKILEECGLTLLNDQQLTQNYTPTDADLNDLISMGHEIATTIKTM